MSFGKTGTAPQQSQNNATPDFNNSLAGKGGAGGGGGVGTAATGSNQPAPFGVPAGLGSPTVGATPAPSGGAGKYGIPSDLNNVISGANNAVGSAVNDIVNQMPQAPAGGGGTAGKYAAGGTPTAGGGAGKFTPMDAYNTYQNNVYGANKVYNPFSAPSVGPTQQVGAALPRGGFNQFNPTPEQRAAIGAQTGFLTGQPRMTGAPSREFPGRPVRSAPLLPAARPTPALQPNFRTGGLVRPGIKL